MRNTHDHRGTRRNRSAFSLRILCGFCELCVFCLFCVFCASVATSAGQLAPRPTRPQVVPPKGPARPVNFKYCTSCHGIDDYAYHALDRAAWDTLLTAKHGGLDVPLPAADRAILLDWLAERFGPDTKPFPRTYVAREVTKFFTDDEAEA